MLHGIYPYSSVFYHDFPGILLVHAVQLLMFGKSVAAFHLLDVLILLIGAATFFKISKYLANEPASWMATIFWCFYYVLEGGNMPGQRDVYVS
ncbi:MAG TPA: hypothetical protein VFX22_05750, partial [Candidatus Kapabacteria bacterium]|nr:hypothetical protein [Candidatus Kapabacteria bacterium]